MQNTKTYEREGVDQDTVNAVRTVGERYKYGFETEIEMEYIIAQNQSPVLEAALQQRKDTRQNPSRTGTLISAMRHQFGGHTTIKR